MTLGTPLSPEQLTQLRRAKYISLTTFRRDGTSVATPVWFALDGKRLVAFTGAQTGKAKRLRRSPHVTVATCTFRGRQTGPTWSGTADILPDEERDAVMRLIRRKYRITKALLDGVVGLIRLVSRKPQTHSVYLGIQLAPN